MSPIFWGMRNTSNASICSVCEHPSSSSTCLLCDSIINTNKTQQWGCQVSQGSHDEAIKMLGPGNKSAQKRWKSIAQITSQSKDVQWARLSDISKDPVLCSPCTDEELEEIKIRISNGQRLSNPQKQQLQRGFQLVGDVHVSIAEGKMMINGSSLPAQVPLLSVLNLLSSKKSRIGWDLEKLFIALGSMNTAAISATLPHHIHRRFMRHNHILQSKQKPGAAAVLSWVEWVSENHLSPPEHCLIHPLGAWSRDVRSCLTTPNGSTFETNLKEAFVHHPPTLECLVQFPWIPRWMTYKSPTQVNINRPWPLQIVNEKLKLIVRSKNNASRKTSIPDNPALWALLLSYIYSPISSEAGNLLYALQYNWTNTESTVSSISSPIKRSIQFLRQVIDGNSDRIFVHEQYMLVIGRLGHFFEIKVGRGAHGAPFIINSIDSLEPRSSTPLCIYDSSFHSSVPLGDTIVSVLLALLDDVKSSTEIDSLQKYLCHHPPLGFPRLLHEGHLRLLNASTLTEFKQIVNQSRDSRIRWLKESPRENENEFEQIQGQNMMHLFRRNIAFNRNRWQFDNHRRPRTSRCDTLVEHALAADSALPHPQFIELWHESLEKGEEGHMHNNYAHRRMLREIVPPQTPIATNNRLPTGDIRNGERRFCEVFSRVWEAMMHHPIGSTFRMGVVDGGDLTFEHCHLGVTLRGQQERRIIRRFANLLGFVENGTFGQRMVFVRRDHARTTAFRDLSTFLDRVQGNTYAANTSPWRWHYAQVVKTPTAIPALRWELEQDLRDSKRKGVPRNR